MASYVSRAPDIESIVRDVMSAVERTEIVAPEMTAPYRVLVSRADLQQRVTMRSRYCRVGVQAWSVRADGTSNLPDSFDLCAAAGAALEAAPDSRREILSAEIESGPSRVTDDVTRLEYTYMTVLLEVVT